MRVIADSLVHHVRAGHSETHVALIMIVAAINIVPSPLSGCGQPALDCMITQAVKYGHCVMQCIAIGGERQQDQPQAHQGAAQAAGAQGLEQRGLCMT